MTLKKGLQIVYIITFGVVVIWMGFEEMTGRRLIFSISEKINVFLFGSVFTVGIFWILWTISQLLKKILGSDGQDLT